MPNLQWKGCFVRVFHPKLVIKMDGKTFQFSVKKTNWNQNPSIVKLLSWKAFPSKKAYFWLGRYSFQCLTDNSWIAEPREDIPFWVELRKRNFSRAVGEVELNEDIPLKRGIMELREEVPFWAELRKWNSAMNYPRTELRNFRKTSLQQRAC